MTYAFLQQYWWFLISLLGALLVFLMFVQGANTQLFLKGMTPAKRSLLVNSTGRKWELTFTTLVTFGGAFFASFPLFYSTSFGGAYWVWILLLVTFVFQAVSYEFQNKNGNLLGSKAFCMFLAINGVLAPFLVGTAVGTFFTGSNFVVNKLAIADNVAPVISAWGNSWHGLDALATPATWLGMVVMLLDIVLGCMYAINNIDDDELVKKLRGRIVVIGLFFVLFFVTWVFILCKMDGYSVDSNGIVSMETGKYLHNLLQMPIVAAMFLVGTLLVLAGIYMGGFTKSRKAIWPAGLGTVLVVMALFFIAGYNGTAYYPSSSDLQSSLTITNSSSSEFTLKTMFWVSLLIPFVLAYIVYAWRQMDKTPITEKEINETENKY